MPVTSLFARPVDVRLAAVLSVLAVELLLCSVFTIYLLTMPSRPWLRPPEFRTHTGQLVHTSTGVSNGANVGVGRRSERSILGCAIDVVPPYGDGYAGKR